MELITTPGLSIRRIVVSTMNNNVYLLTGVGGAGLLIDAAADPEAIMGLLDEAARDADADFHLDYLVTTHCHHDHIGALAAIAAAHPEAQVMAGADDCEAITNATGVAIPRRLTHGEVIEFGGLELGVIGLRGHTPGSVALAVTQVGQVPQIFTGDSLFPGGVGNTRGRKELFDLLLGDVEERVFQRYPDQTVIWPGHGLPTTLGAERPNLAQWRQRGW